jgi:drug/metabolite transporter (DMT)-like permease
VSYVGVMFVTRPAFLFGTSEAASNEAPPLAVMCAFGGAFFQACSYIAMRRLKDVHYLVVIHYFLLFGIGYALLTIWYFDGVSDGISGALWSLNSSRLTRYRCSRWLQALEFPTAPGLLVPLLASGVFAFVGQLFLTLGFQQSNAGIASVMRYLDVVFVLIWDVALLGEDVSPYSVFGGAIILTGASMIVLRRAPVAKTAKTSSE